MTGKTIAPLGPEGGLPASPRRVGVHSPEPETFRTGEVDFRDIWATLKRRRWTIIVTVAAVVLLVAIWTVLATPVWYANTLIRVEEEEFGLLATPALDALTGLGGGGSQIETELRILGTRPIAEDVVDELDLHLVVQDPREVPRALLFRSIELDRRTVEDEFEIRPLGSGGYELVSTDDETPDLRVEFAAGERVEIPGGSFVLADLAGGTDEDGEPLPTSLEFETLLFQEAVEELMEDVTSSRPDREANVLQVAYRSTDRLLVHEVPNAIAAAFIQRRTATNKMDARSTVSFIQAQVDTTRLSLLAMEDSLRQFQERENIVSVEAEAVAQIERLSALQTERLRYDAQRVALERILGEIEDEATDPDYRRLASFPVFFQNDAVGSMVVSLIQADSARSALLARLTPSHPDVVQIEERIDELEGQLGDIGINYLSALEQQISALDEEVDEFNTGLAGVPDQQITFARLLRQVEMLGELYKTLQTHLKEAQVQEAIDDSSVRIVETAIRPLEPVSPNPVHNLALALSLGLVLGVVLAFAREYADRRLHAGESPEVLFGLPTMARIPAGALGAGRNGDGVRLATSADSVLAESFRTLRTNVGLLRRGSGGHRILVTGPSTGEGASETAMNLAVSLAQAGQRTVLVDAVIRRPSSYEAFGVASGPGLSDVLLGEVPLDEVIRPTAEIEFLSVLPAGRDTKQPAELLDGTEMERVLETLRARFDAVIVDAAPVLAVTDAAVLAPRTDGVILVVRAEKTDKTAIALAIRQLRQVDADILGVVVTDAGSEDSSQIYYEEYLGNAKPTGVKGFLRRLQGTNS